MEKLLSGEGIIFLLRPLIVDNPQQLGPYAGLSVEPEVLAVTAAVVHGQRGMMTVGMGKNREVWWKLSAMRRFSKPPVMDRLMWQ